LIHDDLAHLFSLSHYPLARISLYSPLLRERERERERKRGKEGEEKERGRKREREREEKRKDMIGNEVRGDYGSTIHIGALTRSISLFIYK